MRALNSDAPSASRFPTLPIIGAGPAGLALAYELRRRGWPCVVFERGDRPGESWRHMPERLRLVSPWKTNGLPGTRPGLFPRHHSLTHDEFASYLEDYARDHHLPVRCQTEVRRVTKTNAGTYRLITSGGDLTAPWVVHAAGYFSQPFVPDIPGLKDTALPWMHFAQYRSDEQVRRATGQSRCRILVVGQRLSAGQLLRELHEAGHELAVSLRRPIRFGAGPAGWWIFYRLFPWWERWQLRRFGDDAPPVDVRMPGGRVRRWLRQGLIRTFAEVEQFEEKAVRFTDGSSWTPHLVLFATGFRPALGAVRELPLKLDATTGLPAIRNFESVEMPGLFFLGLDGQRNFRSRFLRGIREDAPLLAEHLQALMKSTISERVADRIFPAPVPAP